jgi:hypothetical protein
MKHIDQSTNLGNALRVDPLEARAKLAGRLRKVRNNTKSCAVSAGTKMSLDSDIGTVSTEAPAKLAERRRIERTRLARKREDPIYRARELAANAARMRERRGRLCRCSARRRHAIAEKRAP